MDTRVKQKISSGKFIKIACLTLTLCLALAVLPACDDTVRLAGRYEHAFDDHKSKYTFSGSNNVKLEVIFNNATSVSDVFSIEGNYEIEGSYIIFTWTNEEDWLVYSSPPTRHELVIQDKDTIVLTGNEYVKVYK